MLGLVRNPEKMGFLMGQLILETVWGKMSIIGKFEQERCKMIRLVEMFYGGTNGQSG